MTSEGEGINKFHLSDGHGTLKRTAGLAPGASWLYMKNGSYYCFFFRKILSPTLGLKQAAESMAMSISCPKCLDLVHWNQMVSTGLLWLFNSVPAVQNQEWMLFVLWTEIKAVLIVLASIPLINFLIFLPSLALSGLNISLFNNWKRLHMKRVFLWGCGLWKHTITDRNFRAIFIDVHNKGLFPDDNK